MVKKYKAYFQSFSILSKMASDSKVNDASKGSKGQKNNKQQPRMPTQDNQFTQSTQSTQFAQFATPHNTFAPPQMFALPQMFAQNIQVAPPQQPEFNQYIFNGFNRHHDRQIKLGAKVEYNLVNFNTFNAQMLKLDGAPGIQFMFPSAKLSVGSRTMAANCIFTFEGTATAYAVDMSESGKINKFIPFSAGLVSKLGCGSNVSETSKPTINSIFSKILSYLRQNTTPCTNNPFLSLETPDGQNNKRAWLLTPDRRTCEIIESVVLATSHTMSTLSESVVSAVHHIDASARALLVQSLCREVTKGDAMGFLGMLGGLVQLTPDERNQISKSLEINDRLGQGSFTRELKEIGQKEYEYVKGILEPSFGLGCIEENCERLLILIGPSPVVEVIGNGMSPTAPPFIPTTTLSTPNTPAPATTDTTTDP
jgi:hypothetical protein